MLLEAAILLLTQTGGRIVNPELHSSLDGWKRATYGAEPEIRFQDALVVKADQPSDTAFGQDIDIVPGGLYRLTAMVSTKDLVPNGSAAFGNIQAQTSAGTPIAQGVNHAGTTPWAPETIYFTAPDDGKVHIALFFCGWGKGTGEVSFRDVALAQLDPASTPVKVTDQAIGKDPIDPMQYGQFIEYLCDLVPGMWAEKLCDGSYEGLTPYKFEYIKETDFRQHPWYPCGQTDRMAVERDPSTKVAGETSEHVTLNGPVQCSGGVAQDGIAVKGGENLYFTTYVKGSEIGQFWVELVEGTSVVKSTVMPITKEWNKVRCTLKSESGSENATFRIVFQGPGDFWLDSSSLMPQDNVQGWRPDVVKVLAAVKPGVIRIGGSVLDDPNLGTFEWQDTIGDPDLRKPFSAWGGLQQTGAGLEELVQLIQMVHAEPLICIRYEKKTPEQAADEVEYFNGSTSTPMGSLRAKNGHPEPYRVKYWQIGNERWGKDYWDAVPKFAEAIRKVDPGIQVLSSFPSAELIKEAAPMIDFVSPHQYDVENLAGTKQELEDTAKLIQDNAAGKELHAGVTEWNNTAGDRGLRRARLWNLWNALACSRYHNLIHRYADLVKIANRSNLTNSFCSGIIQTRGTHLYLTPTYHAQWLYSNLAGTIPLRIEGEIPADVSPDISATLSADRSTLTLFCVNELGTAVVRPIDLAGFKLKTNRIEQYVLTDSRNVPEASATNSLDEPNRVAPVRTSVVIAGQKFKATFAPYSLTVLRFSVSG